MYIHTHTHEHIDVMACAREWLCEVESPYVGLANYTEVTFEEVDTKSPPFSGRYFQIHLICENHFIFKQISL